ncbi:glycoside hydrolase family 2 protein [Marinigracilibium pacificum]|uniref:Beta-glucuronidase n=1 Tax=Marinigracilibium pacificum TaxID=2729599 RepID=A0A848IZB8_9BACT|nr:glycoside hydrolase family 2 TIM barrel-domain containing protein [Marinigracilibium pacificum]NMM47564.1 beta-glucuronidase [Marinigracilibium pacificum]
MKSLFIRCILSLFFLIPAYSVLAQGSLIQNVEGRTSMSLDGRWQIIIDPLENGYYNHRYKPKENGFFMNAKMQSPTDLIEYNFDEGYELQVPGDWNTQMKELYYYESTVWYKRSFDYDVNQGKRVFVHFGAINYDAKVYLNGEHVGDHIGGYTSFNFEVTDLLKSEDNFLVVKVNNTRKREAIPTVNTDWWNYGGITRSVSLIETPSNFIKDYFIQLKKGSKNEISGWVQLDKGTSKEIVIEIPELKLNKTFQTDANGRAEISFKAKIDLWSPQNPKLYEVKLSSGDDNLVDHIGFRTITTEGHKILLNGEPIFLSGISIHEEAPFGAGRVTSEAECQVLIDWAKELGCNFVRLAHYPHSEQMVKVAEKNGLLVWSEIPVYWTVLFDNPDTYANAENQLTEMISRDKNRTNIILWSVANETPVSESRVKFLSNLVKKVKSIDNTRLTTAALDTQSSQDGYNMIDDPLGEYIDVIGINQYCGWYFGNNEDCANSKWKIGFDKPLIISEFGGGALQGYHGSENERWTEEYQDALYKYNLKMLDNIEFLAGMTPWILNDFLSPRRNLNKIQNDFNRKGLISEDGIKKKAFFRLQEYYKNKTL